MRYISADYIFPISSPPIPNGIVVIDKNGTIIDIGQSSTIKHQTSALEKRSGIICPGFINTHCHLELSYLKGSISEKKGMYKSAAMKHIEVLESLKKVLPEHFTWVDEKKAPLALNLWEAIQKSVRIRKAYE